MRVYHIRPDNYFAEHLPYFLKESFVGFDWPGLGDLENTSREACLSMLAGESPELLACWQDIILFAMDMQDGDYLLLSDGDFIHIGDLGDYYYVPDMDGVERDIRHRRGVTWLKRIHMNELQPELQRFVQQPGLLTRLEGPVSEELLEQWVSAAGGYGPRADRLIVDPAVLEEALAILREAMRSEEPERRERAAIAILQYAK